MVTMGLDKKDFINLIKNVLLNKEIVLSNIDVNKIIKYAKFHSLEYLIFLGLEKQNFNKESEVYQKFKKVAKVNAYKCIVQDIEFDNVTIM